MSEIWDTKDGPRRVRRDPPTLEEAVLAAQGLADDVDSQVEIVVSLMPAVPAAAARSAVVRLSQRKESERLTVAGRSGAPRAVVVERRGGPRRSAMPARAGVFQGRG